MSLKIYYLGYYDVVSNAEENRNHVLAASNKMTYIVSALERAGFCVELISASQTLNAQAYSAKTVPLGEKAACICLRRCRGAISCAGCEVCYSANGKCSGIYGDIWARAIRWWSITLWLT